MANKIRNTNKYFRASPLPLPPNEYSKLWQAQYNKSIDFFFANVDEALSQALQYDSDDIIDGSIPNSKLENFTVSFGGVTLSLGGVDATPAFNLVSATGYLTSNLTGTITNAQLAGSIANAKLSNSTVSYGGVQLALGASDATPAFDLSDATAYRAGSLTGEIATAQIADDAVTDAKLANSINAAISANSAKVTNATHSGEVTGATALTIADGAVVTARIADDAVTGDKIAHNTISATNMNTSSVGATAIQTSAVTTTKIADANVTTAKIADDAVTDAKLANSINAAITANTAKVTNATHSGEVTGATTLTIADGAVVTARIADDAVTDAKVAAPLTLTTSSAPIFDSKSSTQYTPHIHYKLQKWTGSAYSDHGGVGTTGQGYGNSRTTFMSQGTIAVGVFGIFGGTGTGYAYFQPCTTTGGNHDNKMRLGQASSRWNQLFAGTTTISTSDRNTKQQIETMSDAEARVATAAKSLMRKFKFNDSVEEKGDNARIHFGIVAQDLQDAFTTEGLDASKYAMFCSDTWWEHGGQVYNYKEDAPEGATEVTRLGVRYSELLAFIIASI